MRDLHRNVVVLLHSMKITGTDLLVGCQTKHNTDINGEGYSRRRLLMYPETVIFHRKLIKLLVLERL